MERTETQTDKAPGRPNAADEAAARGLEGALRGLVKLFGAIRFYPAGHPALKEISREALKGFAPLLQGGESIACTVRRDHFLLGETKLGTDNPQLAKFAGHLFLRRVQRLLFLPDLSARDLWHFVQLLTLDAAETQKRGGVPELLRQARVSTLWTNELDLTSVLQRKEALDQEKQAVYGADPGAEDTAFFAGEEEVGDAAQDQPEGEAAAGLSPEARLSALLQTLQQSRSDAQRRELLLQVPPLILQCLGGDGRTVVLQALLLLGRWSDEARLTAECREAAKQALSQARSDEVLALLVATVCDKELADDRREQLHRLAPELGERFAVLLLARLCEEGEALSRKLLSEALVRMGRCALPSLVAALQDQRWYVVRNAVAILGEIREPEALPGIEKTLAHSDHRVRREAIRAITRIGGSASVRLLLQLIEGDFPDLRRQAMLSLGAMKNPAAVPALLRIVQTPDARMRQLEQKKEAIRTLGEIGAADTVAPLAELVLQRRFWFRTRHDELRAAAVAAIGEIGDPAAQEVLEWASGDRSPLVARAAQQALKQVRRKTKR